MTNLWKIVMLALFFTACAASPQQAYSNDQSYQGKAAQDGTHEGHRHGRRKGKHGPPPEAFEACVNVTKEGTPCSFEGKRGSMNGMCKMGRSEKLVCRPEGSRMRRHRGQ